jgi:hypothetical protein
VNVQVTDACAPHVTASPFYTCRRQNVISTRSAIGAPQSTPVRVIEAVELVACRVFNLADQTRQRITFGDVEGHLAQVASDPPACACGRRVRALRVTA